MYSKCVLTEVESPLTIITTALVKANLSYVFKKVDYWNFFSPESRFYAYTMAIEK